MLLALLFYTLNKDFYSLLLLFSIYSRFDSIYLMLLKIASTPSLWDIMPKDEVKGITFNLFLNKMPCTPVKMSNK